MNLLTIESYLSSFYGTDIKELGRLGKKYRWSHLMGLVLLTHEELIKDIPDKDIKGVYAKICLRERTMGNHIMRTANGLMHVDKPYRDTYREFIKENKSQLLIDLHNNAERPDSKFASALIKLGEQRVAQTKQTF